MECKIFTVWPFRNFGDSGKEGGVAVFGGRAFKEVIILKCYFFLIIYFIGKISFINIKKITTT